MAYCNKRQVPLDFFSFHVYSEYPQLKAEQNILTKMMPPTFYKESIHRLQEKWRLPLSVRWSCILPNGTFRSMTGICYTIPCLWPRL